MRFTLVDRIDQITPGERITAVKNLSLGEEYLADHFPGFPVMPGVLMLEAMTQTAAWLVRATDDFSHSMLVLKEARNVRFTSFVKPGQTLVVNVQILSREADEIKVKAEGHVDGRATVSARLILRSYNLSDTDPSFAGNDALVIKELRELFAVLRNPTNQPSATPVASGKPR